MILLLEIIFIFFLFLIFHHHIFYPILLNIYGRFRSPPRNILDRSILNNEKKYPSILLLIPAYNEEKYIVEKINNVASLEYPYSKLDIRIVCDGCTDKTVELAKRTIDNLMINDMNFELIVNNVNRGKIYILNEYSKSENDIIVFSDVSALISIDALKIIANDMKDPTVGSVSGNYCLMNPGSAGEAAYWKYQSNIKRTEYAMGSVIGAHGALYAIRSFLFKPLHIDTINDDFIIPMKVIEKGFTIVYNSNINAIELEKSSESLDWNRRQRIAAGNLQQIWRLKEIIKFRYKGIFFNFFSGKILRAILPFILVTCFFCNIYLASINYFYTTILIGQLAIYGAAIIGYFVVPKFNNPILQVIKYIVKGHFANLIGGSKYLIEQTIAHHYLSHSVNTINMSVSFSKRIFDIILSISFICITFPIFPIIALAIKLDSAGPIFFRQLRIGLCTSDKTHLFSMIKFRTMEHDAESKSGAVWAKKNDSRITRVGRFMRKTRMDELPQLFNVLYGEMSMIGPRPERPEFYGSLEKKIPYFSERTFCVKPGITGLAQVNQGYDTCINDVRKKVGFDHSYALSLSSFQSWILMDLNIIISTIKVVILGRGQ